MQSPVLSMGPIIQPVRASTKKLPEGRRVKIVGAFSQLTDGLITRLELTWKPMLLPGHHSLSPLHEKLMLAPIIRPKNVVSWRYFPPAPIWHCLCASLPHTSTAMLLCLECCPWKAISNKYVLSLNITDIDWSEIQIYPIIATSEWLSALCVLVTGGNWDHILMLGLWMLFLIILCILIHLYRQESDSPSTTITIIRSDIEKTHDGINAQVAAEFREVLEEMCRE